MKKIQLTMNQRGLLTVFGGFTIHLVMGAVFMWGTLNVYITSYFRQLNDHGLSLSLGGAVFPVMMACVATGMPIGIKFLSIVSSPRIYCICASVVACALIFASSYVKYFWLYVFVYGILFGLVSGTLYFIPIYMGYMYFPKYKGFVSGGILCGYGLCSLVFGLSFFKIVNPDDLTQVSDPDGYSYFQGDSISVARNVPGTIRELSWVYLIVSVFGSCFIMKHPSQSKPKKEPEVQQQVEKIPVSNNNLNDNKTEVVEDKQAIIDRYQNLGAPTIKEAFSTVQFYASLLLAILAIAFAILINGNYKPIAKDFGFHGDSYQTIVGALVSIANGLSRPFWSNLVDRFTFKQILTCLLCMQIVLSLTLQLSQGHEVFYAIWAFLINTTFGGCLAIWPVFSARLNGAIVGSKIYGMYWYAFSIANLIQFLVVQFLKPKIGFVNIFYIFAGFATAALIFLHSYTFYIDWYAYYMKKQNKERELVSLPDNQENKEDTKNLEQAPILFTTNQFQSQTVQTLQ